MEDLWEQLSSLIWIILTGLIWGAYRDAVRSRRSLKSIPRWRREMGDLLFWVGSLILFVAGLIVGNWMEIRVYVFIAFAVGYFIYASIIRSVAYPLFRKGFKLGGFLIYPLRRVHERIVFRRRLWWRRLKRRAAKIKVQS